MDTVATEQSGEASVSCRLCCGRWRFPVFVEPIMVLYYMSHLPAFKMRSQFVYDKLAREYGLYSHQNNSHEHSKSNCYANKSSPDYDLQLKVESEAADWQIYLTLALVIPALVSVLYIGPFSDRGGRKIPILMSCTGLMLNSAVTVLVIYLDLHVAWLLISNFIEGALGYSEGIRMGCFSILADVTTKKSRSLRMIVLESTYLVTGGITNLALGYLIKDTGFLLPYAFVGALQIINIVVIIFVLPEVVRNRQDDRPNKLISCTHFQRVGELLSGVYIKGGRPRLYLLLLAFLLFRILYGAKITVVTLYQLDIPLCWNSVKIGYYGVISDVIYGVTSILIVPIFQKLCKLLDGQIIIIGTVATLAQGVFLAFAQTQTMMFIVPLIGFGNVMTLGLYRASFSKLVDPDRAGVIFAAIAVLELATYAISTTLFGAIYSATVAILNGGLTFLVTSGLALASLILVTLYSLRYENWWCMKAKNKFVTLNNDDANTHVG